jgi:hypothetical protein
LPLLLSINLHKQRDVSATALTELASQCNLFRDVNLCNCSNVTDTVLEALSNCTDMQNLSLSRCVNISAGALIDFISKSQKIVSFSLESVPSVNESVVKALAALPKLRYLDISFCRGCTKLPAVLDTLLSEQFVSLRRLDLFGHDFPEVLVQSISRKRPSLEIRVVPSSR